jgi:hypothetical protein
MINYVTANVGSITPANLIAVTGCGQDYVVQNFQSVPDNGSTFALVAFGLTGMLGLRKKLQACGPACAAIGLC